MAVPGNITSHTSVGTNRLIRDGAIPILEAADLLGLYPEADEPVEADRAGKLAPSGSEGADEADTTDPTLTETEQRMLGAMGTTPALVDELAAKAQVPVPEALSALFTLEVAGRVEQEPGWVFRIATGRR